MTEIHFMIVDRDTGLSLHQISDANNIRAKSVLEKSYVDLYAIGKLTEFFYPTSEINMTLPHVRFVADENGNFIKFVK